MHAYRIRGNRWRRWVQQRFQKRRIGRRWCMQEHHISAARCNQGDGQIKGNVHKWQKTNKWNWQRKFPVQPQLKQYPAPLHAYNLNIYPEVAFSTKSPASANPPSRRPLMRQMTYIFPCDNNKTQEEKENWDSFWGIDAALKDMLSFFYVNEIVHKASPSQTLLSMCSVEIWLLQLQVTRVLWKYLLDIPLDPSNLKYTYPNRTVWPLWL